MTQSQIYPVVRGFVIEAGEEETAVELPLPKVEFREFEIGKEERSELDK